MSGRLYGVGLGPGDPSPMTVRAVEAIAQADVIACHSARHGRSIARSVAARNIRADHGEERLVYPVTTGATDHPGGCRGAVDDFYAEDNPGSRGRTWQVGKARALLLEHRAPDTPVVAARDVGGADERVRVVRPAELDPAEVDVRTILLVGSSQTRTVRRGGGDEVVWRPRRYPRT
ncbi:SAM-dependent methyltransferase [Streptomyces tendae]|uniref:SAM-dependent methyltransferase n=1 Tax=Streptomyces tendae TaxID=1932 RepID=UPI002492A5CB|nr:SAM-dependent methyltransferase [Streptomyces tendae]